MSRRRFPAAGPTPVGQRLRASTIHGRRLCDEPEESFDEYMTAKWGEPEWADTEDDEPQPWQ